MSKFKEAIRKYRAEIRQSRKVRPYLGCTLRSHKEMAALLLCSQAGVAIIVIPYSIWQYSLVLYAIVAAFVAAAAYVGCFVWTVRGRDTFPLKQSQPGGSDAQAHEHSGGH